MIEDLLPLDIPPGLYANGTKYQAARRWNDGNLVRFHEGTIRPVGGWQSIGLSGAAISGTATGVISWLLADGTPFMAVGTTEGLYVIDDNDVVYDITPDSSIMHAAPFDWQLSVFGAYLAAVNTLLGDEDISKVNTYVWTGDTGTAADAAWTDVDGPIGAYSAFVTPERFLTVLRGQDPSSAPARTGVDTPYSERRVYWASQEELGEFVSTDTNTGGNFDLSTDGRLVVGAPGRGQSLLWTDVDLWTMTYIGGELIYSFVNAGNHCGIVSRRAFVVLDRGAYWMGRDKFHVFDGYVRNVPCDVSDAVFGNFNRQFAHTVFALPNPRFNEVTWFYPEMGATSPTRYVTYNYEENHWTYGQLQRSCGLPQRYRRDIVNPPVPVMFDGIFMYDHETGTERGGQAFLTSGPVELGNGDRLMRIQHIVPDDKTLGDVQLRLYTAMSPDGLEAALGPFTLQTTTNLRQTARQVRVRLEEVGASDWRVGRVRLAVRPVERRGALSTVLDLTPASLEILPPDVTLDAGQHYTLQSIVRNAAGEALDLAPDVWTSDDTDLMTINSVGTVTVLSAPATVHVQAQLTSHSLVSNIATVHVGPRIPASITIANSAEVEQTGTMQLTAVVRDAFGIVLTGQTLTWESDDETKAMVDDGLVTGVAASGTCNVHAHIASPALVSNACVVTCAKHYVIHTFTINDNFIVTSGSGDAEILWVGGAGSGGSVDGTGVGAGGGGGGGVIHELAHALTPGTYPISIGSGGIAPHADHTLGGGTFGVIIGVSGTSTTAFGRIAGGGGGGGGADATLFRKGRDGGVEGGSGGGGASAGDLDPPPGAYGGGTAGSPDGIESFGNAGGSGDNVESEIGAGGGGAGAPGEHGGLGTGGAGYVSDIESVDGTTKEYGKGGTARVGAGTVVEASMGHGGEGGGQDTSSDGSNGSDGRVVVKYLLVTGIQATGGTRVVLP